LGKTGLPRYLGTIAAVAVVYFGAAKFGLSLAFSTKQVTALWPPTGIAVAALLLGGYRLWPAIYLAAFAVNALVGDSILAAVGIAMGNTLGPVVARFALGRLRGFDPTFSRVRDVLGLIVLGAVLGGAVSATNGVAALALGHIIPWSAYGSVWWVWWVGDAMGILVFAPVILSWAARPMWDAARLTELCALFGGLLLASFVALLGVFVPAATPFQLQYAVFPFIIWAALRFGVRETGLAAVLVTGLSVWGAVHDRGPFATGNLDQRLILLEMFMAVVTVTGLILSAVNGERSRAQRGLQRANDELGRRVVERTAELQGRVTEQRRLTEDLRSAREDLQAILDNVPARITSWHADSTNHFVNRVAAAHFCISADEAVGKHIRDILGPERYARAKPYIDAALAGERQSYEQLDPRPDGSLRYSHVEFVPKRMDGKLMGLYALATDVTDLRDSYGRIRGLAQRLETVREDERRSLAQVLHEGIAQDLFAMTLGLQHLRVQASGRAGVTQVCEELDEAINKCMAAIRQIAYELRPPTLANLPVSVALKEHARYFGEISGLSIRVAEIAPVPQLDEATRLSLFRTAQEALTNVARHAGATNVDITLRADPKSITMDITDDGIGIEEDATAKAGSLGLLGIRERVGALGGTLVVRKNLGAGTTVSVHLPGPKPLESPY
jgi:PAS domain S-box-containing protein